jgi:hypothetical protein
MIQDAANYFAFSFEQGYFDTLFRCAEGTGIYCGSPPITSTL